MAAEEEEAEAALGKEAGVRRRNFFSERFPFSLFLLCLRISDSDT